MRTKPSRARDDFFFWAILAVIGTACVAISQAHGQSVTAPTIDPYKSIAEVVMLNEANPKADPDGWGSATLIATREDLGIGLSLSARHVCEHPGRKLHLKWFWMAGQPVTDAAVLSIAEGSRFDTDMGLILTALPKGAKPLPVRSYNPANLPLIAAGFRDQVLRISDPQNNVTVQPDGVIRLDIGLRKGMSGGPLLDKDGCIVGVIVASDEKSWGKCSDGPRLQEFVKQFMTLPPITPQK